MGKKKKKKEKKKRDREQRENEKKRKRRDEHRKYTLNKVADPFSFFFNHCEVSLNCKKKKKKKKKLTIYDVYIGDQ